MDLWNRSGWLPSFGATRGAKMSTVEVENVATAHILAASNLAKDVLDVAGCSFNMTDFDQNVIAAYHDAAGVGGPWLMLPFCFLNLLVRCAVAAAVHAGPPSQEGDARDGHCVHCPQQHICGPTWLSPSRSSQTHRTLEFPFSSIIFLLLFISP